MSRVSLRWLERVFGIQEHTKSSQGHGGGRKPEEMSPSSSAQGHVGTPLTRWPLAEARSLQLLKELRQHREKMNGKRAIPELSYYHLPIDAIEKDYVEEERCAGCTWCQRSRMLCASMKSYCAPEEVKVPPPSWYYLMGFFPLQVQGSMQLRSFGTHRNH